MGRLRFTIRNSELILAMSVSIYETVKAALEIDDRQNVKILKLIASVVNKISSFPRTKFWCGTLHPEVRSREDKNLLYGLKIYIYILF